MENKTRPCVRCGGEIPAERVEALPETTETWIRVAMIQLMVRRLAARA